ncbi:MAG: ThuA domain-containing protein [Curtobacterium sp.]
MTTTPLRITVWGENVHEQVEQHVAERYPDGMHGAIADGIRENLPEAVVRTATMQEPEHGLTDEVLAETDVLTWWGHAAHQDVDDAVVDRVHKHVLSGMGLVVLHSGHWSKIFGKLMGTTCTLRWRSEHDQELVWTVNPQHPITRGVPNPIVIPEQEMYGEYFDVPTPDELVFISGFTGGEVFRSGMTYRRGLGKIFYFSPGDQDFPVYHHKDVRRVIANAAEWARPEREREIPTLRRYDLGEYFDGQHYRGPFDDEPELTAAEHAPADQPEQTAAEHAPADQPAPEHEGARA